MNYFVTHCDVNFLKYAERLFETLSLFSINKIIFYTVDFTYDCKLDNVIPIKVESKNYLQNLVNYSKYSSQQDAVKAYNVFLKPFIVKNLLSAELDSDNNYCYLDSDCLAINDCDRIFDKSCLVIDYPLFSRGCHDFMMIDGRGDPFINNICDLNYCLEADLMKLLNIDINLRKQYLQTGVFLFNKRCEFFIDEWLRTCSRNEIVDNWRRIAPFHEETVANCLLWKKFDILDLSQSLINLPYNEYDKDKSLNKIKEMLNCLTNVSQEDYFIDIFCRIPSLNNIKNLFFYHGKISDSEYNYIKEQMSDNYLLKINSVSLGDTLAATPTLRKLYNSYNKKINVVTHHPELFVKNDYVDRVLTFEKNINEKYYKEVFNTFLGVGVKKGEYGIEKKHNTIDIRQFHAIDLGFMLNEKEMEYDYRPNAYVEINNLPQNYICLHVANTWPSRTYSDKNWQNLIDLINQKNIAVVLVGKNSHESGFYNINKPTKKLTFKIGLDLTNKLDISQCWHVINKSEYFITMDSGLLHLAGTTDTNIIQLGSSINNKLRAPYRNGSQDYKYKYVNGSCNIFCASDIKYGVKEWKTIQGVPPLINCLENKSSFDCHPHPCEIITHLLMSKCDVKLNNKKKFLFLTAHLSTGGSPKYLEWLICKKINEGYSVKVIEWNLYSDNYVVQRNSIINLIGFDNFYSVGHYTEDDITFYSKEQSVINYIKDFDPDFIHLNECSEAFAIKPLSNKIINFLYNKDRTYKLFETSHSANTNLVNKKNIPDELWLVSPYQYNIAKNTNIKSVLVEMHIEKKIRPDREKTLKSLCLDPDKMHILQVGLFCANKNQKFTFEVANQFINHNVQFHFVGNECYINECGLNKNLNNCMVWGERSDVDLFMSCMDLFVMPSHEELNPIALKEAVSWGMKCFVSNLDTIKNQYKNIDSVFFIKNDNFFQYIKNNLHKFYNNKNVSIYEEKDEMNNIFCTFNPSPKVEILGNEKTLYNIKFIDEQSGTIHFESNINTNMWTASSIKYFCKWKVIVINLKLGIEKIFSLNLEGKNVKIINESSSLGDTICWMVAVDKFQKLHNCKVDYYTTKKDLFVNEYPNINFYNYNETNDINYYVQYSLGCFDQEKKDFFRKDWRLQSLQEIAFSILGLDYVESKTEITIKNKFKLNFNKYVCIATQSTSQSRYWNNDDGWVKTVDYLKKLGYKVVCVDKHHSFGASGYINICPNNIDYFAGEHSLDEIIDIINRCEFFIGLSSGLSWLTWAIGKKIISINSSVSSNFEFYTPYRIQNLNVCNSCFDNINYKFEANNWKWCPVNKDFECSKKIEFDDVKKVIDNLIDGLRKTKKIKIVHLQTSINSETEKKSRKQFDSFNFDNLEYVLNINKPYEGKEYQNNCLYPGLVSNGPEDTRPDKLIDKHYGCYDSHKKAFINQFDDDLDFLIICEGDVKLEVPNDLFYDTVMRIANIMNVEDIAYFSFGDKSTLETKVLQSNEISVPKNQTLCYITDKIIGIQCIMFNKKYKHIFKNSFVNEPWYIADGWYNRVAEKNNLKIGILKNRITSQYDGYSLLDNRVKNF
jgi:autotransporter strand-loop-strand O-heptosyltransferase